MTNLSFDHIHYRYSDLKVTRDFYVGIMEAIDLGQVELAGKPNLQLELGGVTLFFADKADDPKPVIPVSAEEKLGVYHITFLVADCDEATDYYHKRGATVAKPPFRASDNIRASFLSAPDGMLVELKEIAIYTFAE
jgi:catechol 2,3-dioxygenase-like lactoylglutathione lyase family enzyme